MNNYRPEGPLSPSRHHSHLWFCQSERERSIFKKNNWAECIFVDLDGTAVIPPSGTMFLKRQQEVARVYSDIVDKKLMNSENITDMVLHGSGSENFTTISSVPGFTSVISG